MSPRGQIPAQRSVDAPPGPRGRAVVVHIRAVAARWARTRPARANARFSTAGGSLLTGGIGYAALFSVVAALTLGFTVFTAVLGQDPGLRAQVLRSISAAFPGLLDAGNGSGAISPDALTLNVGLNIAGAAAVIVLVFSAISCMAALRTAVRAMFGLTGPGGNVVTVKLRELGGFVAMAGAVLVSAVLSAALTSAVHWLLGLLGLADGVAWAVTTVGVLVSFVVDALTFVLIVTVLAGGAPAEPGPSVGCGGRRCRVGARSSTGDLRGCGVDREKRPPRFVHPAGHASGMDQSHFPDSAAGCGLGRQPASARSLHGGSVRLTSVDRGEDRNRRLTPLAGHPRSGDNVPSERSLRCWLPSRRGTGVEEWSSAPVVSARSGGSGPAWRTVRRTCAVEVVPGVATT